MGQTGVQLSTPLWLSLRGVTRVSVNRCSIAGLHGGDDVGEVLLSGVVHLTERRFHDVALYARAGLRDCLSLVALHDRDRKRSFLNGGTVLAAVSTWERFIYDLADAAQTPERSLRDAGWGREDSAVPWPGSRADRGTRRSSRQHRHLIDQQLIENQVLDSPLTRHWRVLVAKSWDGADPLSWRLATFTEDGPDGDTLRQSLLGAKSARDAVAHRLYFKKARQAQGQLRVDMPLDEVDFLDWCYVWQSDNTWKSGRRRKDHSGSSGDDGDRVEGKPTIQGGCARGVVALFVQLIDQTINVVRAQHGWTGPRSRLPKEWFAATISKGRFAGLTAWGGRTLPRSP